MHIPPKHDGLIDEENKSTRCDCFYTPMEIKYFCIRNQKELTQRTFYAEDCRFGGVRYIFNLILLMSWADSKRTPIFHMYVQVRDLPVLENNGTLQYWSVLL